LIANATRQPVPATDSDATRGGTANVFTVEPEATEARNNAAKENTPAVEEQAPPRTETQAPLVASRESRPATSRNRSSASAARTQQPVGTGGRNEAAVGGAGTAADREKRAAGNGEPIADRRPPRAGCARRRHRPSPGAPVGRPSVTV
jgi:hypothetical protein